MASITGCKKSVVSSATLQVNTFVADNTPINEAADQSSSLYQQCSSLYGRLIHIHDFTHYFSLAATPNPRRSTDPVTQLWDLFSISISLYYLFG